MAIKIFFNRFFNKNAKLYGHYQSLGYNCEVAYRFFKKFNFVESGLFVWANALCIENVINAIKNTDLILSKDISNEYPMWLCKETNISFHGVAKLKNPDVHSEENNEVFEKDKEELITRLDYLKDKFSAIANDGKTNLYVYKYSTRDTKDVKEFSLKIKELKTALDAKVSNNFDLLVILERNSLVGIENELSNLENVYIRRVEFFAEENKVTSKKYDKVGWNKIFDEFKPAFKLKKKKKFKFEDVWGGVNRLSIIASDNIAKNIIVVKKVEAVNVY